MADRYAVMGHPVAHSKSPFIHARFAEQTGQDIDYVAIDVAPGTFERAVAEFRDGGGCGLNVTVPYKEAAHALAEIRTAGAERAGAVNTLWFDDAGRTHGDNTDGPGLVRDLRANHGIAIEGARVVLLGAGGAARGVLGPLLDERPAGVLIANRTVSRGESLAARFAGDGAVTAAGFDGLAGQRADLVINATSASLHGALPPLPDTLLAAGGVCYDMMYGAGPTAFVSWGREHGARLALDGLGMLVEQAAASFLRWRAVAVETRPVIDALRVLLRA